MSAGSDRNTGPKKPNITRSRKGCHNCKRLKIKCDEKKPKCSYCIKTDITCDYSIKLTWGGRPYKDVKKRKHEPGGDLLMVFESKPPKKQKSKSAQVQFVNGSTNNRNSSSFVPMTPVNLVQGVTSNHLFPGTLIKQEDPNKLSESPSLDLMDSQPATKEASPLSFNTPTGVSILSSFDQSNLEKDPLEFSLNNLENTNLNPSMNHHLNGKLNKNMNQNFNHHLNENINENLNHNMNNMNATETSHNEIKDDHFSSLFSTMPYLSDGIESLSNALERVADGGHQFSLQNSELFNKFISSNTEDKRIMNTEIPGLSELSPNFSIGNFPSPDASESNMNNSQFDEEFIYDYSTDLAKVDAYLPKQKSNLLPDFVSTNRLLSSFLSGSRFQHKIRQIEDQEDDEEEIDGQVPGSVPLDLDSSPNSSHSSQINYNLDSIPPLLTPLPELLIQVPYYRQLMHYWVNVAADNLVPAPSHIYKENPFKVILPQMAMEYPAILTTILAFAATSVALITGKKASEEIVSQLIARSCNMLLKMLKDKDEATSDGTLATVLLLSCYELLSNNNFERHRAHTLGARQIIMARKLKLPTKEEEYLNDSPDSSSLSKSTSSVALESDIAYFLMRWFVYVDVIGALSATKNSQYYLSNQQSGAEYAPVESVNSLNETDTTASDPKRDIDYILGFDVKFLPQLTDIAILIRRTNSYLEHPDTDKTVLPLEIITKALEVRASITAQYEKGEARRQARIDKMNPFTSDEKSDFQQVPPQIRKSKRSTKRFENLVEQHNILRCTNKFFCDMGLLNLYRRVLRVPRESAIIQDLANGIGRLLEDNISPGSSAEICSIFCLFCAACETLDEYSRNLFRTRFTALTEMGNVSAVKSLQIMDRCWETGEDWIEASKILNIDITLL